jgi:phosphoglycerate kinase
MRNLLADPKLILPLDVLAVPETALGTVDMLARARVAPVGQVRSDEVILDHGPGTSALLASIAEKAKTILWNGPLGNYENGFVDGTVDFARAVARSSAHSIVGGGDTVAAIENLGLLPHFSFVSTGGGAMLDFLVQGTLPGIEALG